MPKENIIPIENKKPFETVYELKDEYKVPSFEEFMKTYQSDDNLNYADLNSSDVGTQKGYGPVIDPWIRTEKGRKEVKEYVESLERHEKEQERKKEQDLCLKNGCWESRKYGDRKYCSEHREDADSGEWAAKLALGIGASAFLGPVGTLATGSALWGVSEIGKASSSSEDAKETWNSFSSLGSSMVAGEAIGLGITKTFGGSGKLHDAIQSGVAYGQPAWEFTVHEVHKSNGISYDSSCEICKIIIK